MEEDGQLVFGPCSVKQQIVLNDFDTDLLVVGGGNGGYGRDERGRNQQ